jgi:phosphatidylethanolamine/phosphatidyl-N-methylethanolamine N-methyltransferase
MKNSDRKEPWKGTYPKVMAVPRRHSLFLEDDPVVDFNEQVPLSKTLASYWRFLVAGVANALQTGALVPSQRFLISRMITPVPADYEGQILELGAGTGALTVRLAARCPKARVLACEINPVLARDLEDRMQANGLNERVQVISDSAEYLLSRFRGKGSYHPDFIISGIPLGNLERKTVLSLIRSIHSALAPGGLYIQFQHSTFDRRKIKQNFSRLRTVPVFLNFPPAVIYYALK